MAPIKKIKIQVKLPDTCIVSRSAAIARVFEVLVNVLRCLIVQRH